MTPSHPERALDELDAERARELREHARNELAQAISKRDSLPEQAAAREHYGRFCNLWRDVVALCDQWLASRPSAGVAGGGDVVAVPVFWDAVGHVYVTPVPEGERADRYVIGSHDLQRLRAGSGVTALTNEQRELFERTQSVVSRAINLATVREYLGEFWVDDASWVVDRIGRALASGPAAKEGE